VGAERRLSLCVGRSVFGPARARVEVIAQQSLNAPRLWALSLASGIVALTAYLLVGVLTRLSAPWATGQAA